MKTLTLFLLIAFYVNVSGQDLKTGTATNWNTLRIPGFYQSQAANIINAPANNDWFWGINIAHSTNASVGETPYHYGAQILFSIKTVPTVAPEMYIRSMSKVGEGMWAKVLHSKGNHAIDGKLTAKEVEIKVNTGADFVFKPGYKLKPLSEIESFVKENQHLPDIPSEKEMQENGLNLNDMQIKLLQKIEELTLYVIDLKKENEQQQSRISSLESELVNLKNK